MCTLKSPHSFWGDRQLACNVSTSYKIQKRKNLHQKYESSKPKIQPSIFSWSMTTSHFLSRILDFDTCVNTVFGLYVDVESTRVLYFVINNRKDFCYPADTFVLFKHIYFKKGTGVFTSEFMWLDHFQPGCKLLSYVIGSWPPATANAETGYILDSQ